MTYRQAEQHLALDLQNIYSARESTQLAAWIMEKITGSNRTDRLLNKDKILPMKMQTDWEKIRERMLMHEPIQYVLNEAPFMGLLLEVNQHTLIPRPETEELVDWILNNHPEKNIRVMDAGTGSGCIALALKQRQPSWEITAGDISADALQVAQTNAARYQLSVQFTELDILVPNHAGWQGKYHLIVSNPPYIPLQDKESMAMHVHGYEPATALFVPNEHPLTFYSALAEAASLYLEPSGMLYVEINDALGAATRDLFLQKGWAVELKKDLQGNHRMIQAKYSG